MRWNQMGGLRMWVYRTSPKKVEKVQVYHHFARNLLSVFLGFAVKQSPTISTTKGKLFFVWPTFAGPMKAGWLLGYPGVGVTVRGRCDAVSMGTCFWALDASASEFVSSGRCLDRTRRDVAEMIGIGFGVAISTWSNSSGWWMIVFCPDLWTIKILE